jgi:hypothetical protein
VPETLELAWPHGSATVSTLAGMLVDLRLDLPSGPFRPLAPLLAEDDPALPGHLRGLGGEFACVPFGSADGVDVDGWPTGAADPLPHGFGADTEWTVQHAAPDVVELVVEYPADSPVRRLVRRLRAQDGPGLEVDLQVEVDEPCTLPIGMHPILRVPDRDELVLDVAFEQGFTYPVPVHATSRTAPARRFTDLANVPARDGGTVDLRRLPIGPATEDVVLLAGARSPARVHVEEADAVLVLEWDDALLPSLLLWHSDRALDGPPWAGRYRGIGLEPVAAAFDLPVAVSVAANPVAEAGCATAVRLDPDHPLALALVLRAEPAAGSRPVGQEGPLDA